MKRIIAVLLLMMMALSLVGCSNKDENGDPKFGIRKISKEEVPMTGELFTKICEDNGLSVSTQDLSGVQGTVYIGTGDKILAVFYELTAADACKSVYEESISIFKADAKETIVETDNKAVYDTKTYGKVVLKKVANTFYCIRPADATDSSMIDEFADKFN